MSNPSFPDKLLPGEELIISPTPAQQNQRITDRLTSQNGTFRLMLQPDGNLVLSVVSMSSSGPHYQPIWASGTQGKPVYNCKMQADGNLVIRSAAGAPLWDSHTAGRPGASAVLQDDGNFVIYAADGRTPIRWTGTAAGQAQSGNIFRPMQPPM